MLLVLNTARRGLFAPSRKMLVQRQFRPLSFLASRPISRTPGVPVLMAVRGKKTDSDLPRDIDPIDPRSNSLRSRIPTFPLGKEAQPTIIPKPDTPVVGPRLSFTEMMLILKNKKEPELLYEAEPHRLYFVICFCGSFVLALYGIMFGENLLSAAYMDWVANPTDEPFVHQLFKFGLRSAVPILFTSVFLFMSYVLARFPGRLIRRLYYLPGSYMKGVPEHMQGVDHIRFVTHPYLPGKPSPVYTVNLNQLKCGDKTTIFTKDGFYGTASKSSFFFLLWEGKSWVPWVVDRSGWFWGDGRVWDVLFGKKSIKEAEKGLSNDDKIKQHWRIQEAEKAERKLKEGKAFYINEYKRGFERDFNTLKSTTVGLVEDIKEKRKEDEKKALEEPQSKLTWQQKHKQKLKSKKKH
ncbi:hypothetical protein CJU89_3227 [Yarrowia sp. B02]|nr:hypothetical protein CJU89_3227 [Yarrowia sp. B02]